MIFDITRDDTAPYSTIGSQYDGRTNGYRQNSYMRNLMFKLLFVFAFVFWPALKIFIGLVKCRIASKNTVFIICFTIIGIRYGIVHYENSMIFYSLINYFGIVYSDIKCFYLYYEGRSEGIIQILVTIGVSSGREVLSEGSRGPHKDAFALNFAFVLIVFGITLTYVLFGIIFYDADDSLEYISWTGIFVINGICTISILRGKYKNIFENVKGFEDEYTKNFSNQDVLFHIKRRLDENMARWEKELISLSKYESYF